MSDQFDNVFYYIKIFFGVIILIMFVLGPILYVLVPVLRTTAANSNIDTATKAILSGVYSTSGTQFYMKMGLYAVLLTATIWFFLTQIKKEQEPMY